MEGLDSSNKYCERRSFPRHPCSIRLDESRVIRDLSLGGAFVEGPPLSHGSELSLQFSLSNPQEAVGAKGKVVFTAQGKYGAAGGYGVQFLEIDPRSRLFLQLYLQNIGEEIRERAEIRNRMVAETESFLKEVPYAFEEIKPEFKRVVCDFRAYLQELKRHLEKMELREEPLLTDFLDLYEGEFQKRTHTFILEVSAIIRDFKPEEHPLHRRYFQTLLLDLTGDSAFFKRAMEKPFGYAGDYFMMELLYKGLREGASLWDKTINSCLTSIPLGQAVRNRAWYLKEWIEKTAAGRPGDRPRVMSLACGPCEEVRLFTRHCPDLQAEFYLIDQDPRALAYAEVQFQKLKENTKTENLFHLIPDSTRDFLKDPAHPQKYPKMHLIYTAGLYDYLKKEAAASLTGVLYEILEPGGMLVLGNFSKGHPFGYFIEYASEWFLIHRSPEDMLSLAPINLTGGEKWVEREASGVNLFLCIRKPIHH